MDRSLLIAALAGVAQGLFEWLPVSSEGNLTVLLTLLGESPDAAVEFALFLHLGTAVAATLYYRADLVALGRETVAHRRAGAEPGAGAGVLPPVPAFLVVATAASCLTGLVALVALETLVTALTGGALIALVGALLVGTGLLQRLAGAVALGADARPSRADAVLVGAAQGLAILPGVSRSGMTTGVLLLRGQPGPEAFRLSFLLSVPASLLGGGVGLVGAGGLPPVGPVAAAVALGAAALVGLATIDALMRIVRRLRVWLLCVGLGGLTVVGGALVALV
jgi:undecaprenyl-diphosphatase